MNMLGAPKYTVNSSLGHELEELEKQPNRVNSREFLGKSHQPKR
jgi:hypothetical protein